MPFSLNVVFFGNLDYQNSLYSNGKGDLEKANFPILSAGVFYEETDINRRTEEYHQPCR